MNELAELEAVFGKLEINVRQPGFYDEPAFIAAEAQDPRFLEKYAEYVATRSYSEEYLEQARHVVLGLGRFLFEKLREDGRKGACIDAGMALSRMLEREGIWNYVVKGALTIHFDTSTRLAPTHFCPIMASGNPATAGHVWVVAPPFKVIDVSVAFQPYSRGESRYIRECILAQKTESDSVEWQDIIDPECVPEFLRSTGRLPTLEDVENMFPGLLRCVSVFGVHSIRLPKTVLKYTASGIGASVEPLEKIRSLSLSGRYPEEVYREFLGSQR